MNYQEFIDALFPEEQLGENAVLLWTLPTRVSYWSVPNKRRNGLLSVAENKAIIERGLGDVYFGLGVVPSRKPSGAPWQRMERADIHNIIAIPGMWADIDVVGGGHKNNKRYPESIPQALELLGKLPLQPSILVETGGGLHAYWLFDKLLYATGPDNSQFASKIVMQWQALISQIFNKNGGYGIDSTHDLARILRLPDTVNRKYQPPREVKVIMSTEERFTVDQVVEVLSRYDLPDRPKFAADVEMFKMETMDGKYELEEGRLDSLFEFEPRARDCYMMSAGTVKAKMGDQSPSAFEMSLANYAAMYGFTDEEIATMLVMFRVKHNLDAKKDKHYEVTVMKARAAVNSRNSMETLVQTSISPIQAEIAPDEINCPEKILESISNVVGVQCFTGFKKILSEPPAYVASINGEDLPLGGIDTIMTERIFQKVLADGTKYIMPKIGKNWNSVAQNILNVCVDVALGTEATTAGMHISNLRTYFEEKIPAPLSYDVLGQNRPVESSDDGFVYFSAEDYKHWFYLVNYERLNRKDFYNGLNQARAEPCRLQAENDEGKKVTRSYFRISKAHLYVYMRTPSSKFAAIE
jgi:hypothetical protein